MNAKAEEIKKGTRMENCVKWGQLVMVLLAVVGILTGLFMYQMDLHSSRPHQDAVTQNQITDLKSDLKANRENVTKTREAVASNSAKLDNIQQNLKDLKRLVQ